jgi:hypothetical protein
MYIYLKLIGVTCKRGNVDISECWIEGHIKGFLSYVKAFKWISPRVNIESSANKGAQCVPMGIPTDYWKTWSPVTIKISSVRTQASVLFSTSEYMCVESEWFLRKWFFLNDWSLIVNISFSFFDLRSNYLWGKKKKYRLSWIIL